MGRAPLRDRPRLLAALGDLESDPFHGDAIRLRGKDDVWRRRVGAWRIVFELDRPKRIIRVGTIVRRTSTTY